MTNMDFSRGKRGAVVRVPKGKSRITIRIDDGRPGLGFENRSTRRRRELPETMINTALREHIENRAVPIEKTPSPRIREELRKRGAA